MFTHPVRMSPLLPLVKEFMVGLDPCKHSSTSPYYCLRTGSSLCTGFTLEWMSDVLCSPLGSEVSQANRVIVPSYSEINARGTFSLQCLGSACKQDFQNGTCLVLWDDPDGGPELSHCAVPDLRILRLSYSPGDLPSNLGWSC